MPEFQSFDEQPIPDLNSEALDFRAASELFARVRKLAPSAFRSLRVTTEHHGREVPTVGGFLLFARNRFDRFPDAWLQTGRFAGKDRARILDSNEIRSYLPQAADQAIAFVPKHLSRGAVITGAHRVDRWTVPMVAGGNNQESRMAHVSTRLFDGSYCQWLKCEGRSRIDDASRQ